MKDLLDKEENSENLKLLYVVTFGGLWSFQHAFTVLMTFQENFLFPGLNYFLSCLLNRD